MVELSDLSVFKAVVESGGISNAASKLNRVPSNVTARIKKLEAELDKPLFIRERNRLRVSPAGEQLFLYAERILNLADEAVDRLSQQAPSGTLKVGSMEALAASRLSPLLLEYHQKYAGVELEVSTNPTGVLIQQVLSGVVDLALVADPPKDERLEIIPVFREHLVLVSNALDDTITHPRDLGEKPTLIGFGEQCAYRKRLAEWVNQSDVVAKVVGINSYHALLTCVTAGMGVGLIPEVLLDFYPFKDGLKVHNLPDGIQYSTTCMIWRKDSVKPSLTAFSEILRAAAEL